MDMAEAYTALLWADAKRSTVVSIQGAQCICSTWVTVVASWGHSSSSIVVVRSTTVLAYYSSTTIVLQSSTIYYFFTF